MTTTIPAPQRNVPVNVTCLEDLRGTLEKYRDLDLDPQPLSPDYKTAENARRDIFDRFYACTREGLGDVALATLKQYGRWNPVG